MEEQDSHLNIRHQEEQSIGLQILLKAWTNCVLHQSITTMCIPSPMMTGLCHEGGCLPGSFSQHPNWSCPALCPSLEVKL